MALEISNCSVAVRCVSDWRVVPQPNRQHRMAGKRIQLRGIAALARLARFLRVMGRRRDAKKGWRGQARCASHLDVRPLLEQTGVALTEGGNLVAQPLVHLLCRPTDE